MYRDNQGERRLSDDEEEEEEEKREELYRWRDTIRLSNEGTIIAPGCILSVLIG